MGKGALLLHDSRWQRLHGTRFTTNLPFPAKIKYYDQSKTGTGNSYYLATAAGYNLTQNQPSPPGWFGTFISPDGINFSPAGGLQVLNPIPVQDPGQLVADGNGWIQFSPGDLEALAGAGQSFNLLTWGIYGVQFILSLP